MQTPPFVAHRGDPFVFPENTLQGAFSALNTGAHFFEVDVQLTADCVPILYHDGDLQRLSATSGHVWSHTLESLQKHGAFHPERFGQQHRGNPITTLQQLLTGLSSHQAKENNKSKVFVELKLDSIGQFGRAVVLDQVLPIVDAHQDQVAAIISKDDLAIELTRERLGCPIGWVLPEWDHQHQTRCAELQPDFLFCNQHRLPASPTDRWQGDWKWVIYTVNEESVALKLLEQGVDMIETDDIGPMLKAWENSLSRRR